MIDSWRDGRTEGAKARFGAVCMRIGVGLVALLGACTSGRAGPADVAAAHVECVKQARAGTRHPSTHAKAMSAACDALAAQAGQANRAQTVPALASDCRDEAGKGHPPGASPYKRQFRDMHKMRSRAACSALAEAVLSGADRAP
jgi:hypothetical protein